MGDFKGQSLTAMDWLPRLNVGSHNQTTGSTQNFGDGKPPYSYAQLISMAIGSVSGSEKRMALADIYKWITDNYAYYQRIGGTGWKNSIRHNLSLNKCFKKVSRDPTDPGKGSYWMMDENPAPEDLVDADPLTYAHAAGMHIAGGAQRKKKRDPNERRTPYSDNKLFLNKPGVLEIIDEHRLLGLSSTGFMSPTTPSRFYFELSEGTGHTGIQGNPGETSSVFADGHDLNASFRNVLQAVLGNVSSTANRSSETPAVPTASAIGGLSDSNGILDFSKVMSMSSEQGRGVDFMEALISSVSKDSALMASLDQNQLLLTQQFMSSVRKESEQAGVDWMLSENYSQLETSFNCLFRHSNFSLSRYVPNADPIPDQSTSVLSDDEVDEDFDWNTIL